MKDKSKKLNKGALEGLRFSVLLLVIAIVSITAATVAWFSIADNGRVQSMNLEITTGTGMRFDLYPHSTFEEYTKTLGFDQIADSMKAQKGFDMRSTKLDPVTTADYDKFTFEDGRVASDRSGSYLTFTLHFMAKEDMVVHLTSENEDDSIGTIITSKTKNLDKAMRISFTADGTTYVYDPGMGNTSEGGRNKMFGLPEGQAMEYNQHNAMFSLQEGVDKEVLCHIWLEGTDPLCVDSLKGADYQIALKFKGTDENNRPLDESRYEENQSENNDKPQPPEYYTQRDDTADEAEDEEEGFLAMLKQFWNNLVDIFSKHD